MSNPNVLIDREKYIGGSDLPSIFGYNIKYGITPVDFAKQKAGIVPNPFTGNQFTKYGQKLEPIIREYINATNGANYLEDTTIDVERGYRGNTDGLDFQADIPLIEIKTFGEQLDVEYYNLQCQFYLEMFDVESCLLIGYKRPANFYVGVDYAIENDDSYFNFEFDENRIETHIIKRDRKQWEKINERIVTFKKAVEELKNNENMDEYTFNSFFYGNELVKVANAVAVLENKFAELKEVEKRYKEVREKLYNLFEEKGLISVDLGNLKITKIAPTSYETVGVDSKKLQEEKPEIYEEYKTVKTTNRKGYILITNKKEEKIK